MLIHYLHANIILFCNSYAVCFIQFNTPTFNAYLPLCSELISPTVRVIREVYEGENAHEMFQSDLNKALFDKVRFIVIEPTRLGEETERWIAVGNCLHKTALISGTASIAISE